MMERENTIRSWTNKRMLRVLVVLKAVELDGLGVVYSNYMASILR